MKNALLIALALLVTSCSNTHKMPTANRFQETSYFTGNENGTYGVRDIQSTANSKTLALLSMKKDGFETVAIAKFHADGNLDATFGENGFLILDLGKQFYYSGMRIQADGKILLTGTTIVWATTSAEHEVKTVVIRATANGALDTSFNTRGWAEVSGLERPYAMGIMARPDGKIVVPLLINPVGEGSAFACARFTADGVQEHSYIGHKIYRRALYEFLSDGGIVSADHIYQSDGAGYLRTYRYDRDGALDASYGAGATIPVTIDVTPLALQRLPDGGLFIFAAPGNSEPGLTLYRFDQAGNRDATFGDNGFKTVSHPWGRFFPQTFRLLSTGKLLVGGWSNSVPNATTQLDIARLHLNGELDRTFDDDGHLKLNVTNAYDVGALAELPNGEVLVGGATAREVDANPVEQGYYILRLKK